MANRFSPDAGTRLGLTSIQPDDAPPEEIPYCLELVAGVERTWQVGTIFRLQGKELRIGRVPLVNDTSNDVVIGAESVSRRHASLVLKGKQWWCKDDGSAGGTFVNDTKLEGPIREMPIMAGDRVRLGPRVTLICRGEKEGRDAIVHELPAPLARLDSALVASAERQKRASTLFHELDRVFRFLAACALAVVRRDAETDEALRTKLAEVLLRGEYNVLSPRRGLTTGAWKSAFANVTKLIRGESVLARALRLVAKEMAGLDSAISLRNLWAHDHTPTERELEEAEPDLEQLVSNLLGASAHFASLPLVSVGKTEILVEGYLYSLYVLRGVGRARVEENVTLPARMLRRWCYLFDSIGDPATASPLLLAPLLAAEETRAEGQRTMFAERIDVGPENHPVELASPEGLAPAFKLPLPWYPSVRLLSESVAEKSKG